MPARRQTTRSVTSLLRSTWILYGIFFSNLSSVISLCHERRTSPVERALDSISEDRLLSRNSWMSDTSDRLFRALRQLIYGCSAHWSIRMAVWRCCHKAMSCTCQIRGLTRRYQATQRQIFDICFWQIFNGAFSIHACGAWQVDIRRNEFLTLSKIVCFSCCLHIHLFLFEKYTTDCWFLKPTLSSSACRFVTWTRSRCLGQLIRSTIGF